MTKTLFSKWLVTLPSFAVALGGALLALAWLELSWIVPVAVSLALIVMGGLAYRRGDAQLDRDRPKAVAAVRYLRWSIAAPVGLAALVGAGILVLGIDVAPADDWSEQKKQLTAAFTAALTTYLTTVFIKGADEADEGWVGAFVKDRFTTRLEGRFPLAATDVRDAAFDLTRGWDADERMSRARTIDQYIAEGGEVLERS